MQMKKIMFYPFLVMFVDLSEGKLSELMVGWLIVVVVIETIRVIIVIKQLHVAQCLVILVEHVIVHE